MRNSKKAELLKQIWDLIPVGSSFCGYSKDEYLDFGGFLRKNYKYSRLEQLQSDLEYIKSELNK